MGVDLNFLVPKYPDQDKWVLAADIGLERRSELWPAVDAIPSRLARPVWCHYARRSDGESEYGEVRQDRYGQALRYVRAGDLSILAMEEGAADNHDNVAAFAYVAAMPASWPIILWWC